MRIGRSRRTTRLLAGVAGLGVAVGAVIIAHPVGASTTVPTQLALSGIVTGKSPIGGSVVGIHPGDSVDLKAAPAGLSTQGLNNLGIPLGDLLGSIVGTLAGYQVVLHLPASFPGGKREVKLGACGGKDDLKVSFPNNGTYNFTWSAYSVTVLPLLGCSLNQLTLDGNQLKKAGIALNASNQWMGKIVVATDPPNGGLSVQIPSVGADPNVGGAQLPHVGLPGATLPTVPVSLPSASLGVPTPKPSSSTPPPGNVSVPGGLNYTPPGGMVQDSVVPKGYGGDDGAGHLPNSDLGGVLLNGLNGGSGVVPGPLGSLPNGNAPGAGSGKSAAAQRDGHPIDLAANKAPAGQMPVLLAILAIIALSLVTATYARLYLMRRHVS
jgi:hypothetical protein